MMSFEQAKMIAAEAVRLDRQGQSKQALGFYIDSAQMLLELTKHETKDPKKREAFKNHAIRYLERAEYLKSLERRNQLMKERAEIAELSSGHWADVLLGDSILLPDGTSGKPSAYVGSPATRLLLLFFGARWSGKSRSLVPLLRKHIDEANKKCPDIAKVVFVSSDKSPGEFSTFFRQQEVFAALSWSNRERKGRLTQRLGINESRLPYLILLDCKADGNVLTKNAQTALRASGDEAGSSGAIFTWLSTSSDATIPDELTTAVPTPPSPVILRLLKLIEDERAKNQTKDDGDSSSVVKLDPVSTRAILVNEFGESAVLSDDDEIGRILARCAKGDAPTATDDDGPSLSVGRVPVPRRREGEEARWADVVFGTRLMEKSGRHMAPSKTLAGCTLVTVFFGGAWSTESRRASTHLSKLFDTLSSSGNSTASNVFVSYDRTAVDCSKFWKSIPGYLVPFEDRYRKGRLEGFFKVSHVPRVVVLNGRTGEIAEKNGLREISAWVKGGCDDAEARALLARWSKGR